MKHKVYYAPEAQNDLGEIQEYIESELCDPEAAIGVIFRILDEADKLKDFPDMGIPLSRTIQIETDYRYLISGNYMIFYRHLGDAVYVDRVLYGRRNYLRVLFGE